jgi:glutamate synthase (NADPH/NADH) small chain
MAKNDTPRQEMPLLDIESRRRTFREVALGYTPEQAMMEARRCIQCKKPRCVPGCPVAVDIPKFVSQVADGDFLGAYETIKKTNSLPAIAGRVCPQEEQCEGVCVLSTKGQAVAVGRLERFVADFAGQVGRKEVPPQVRAEVGAPAVTAQPTGKRVAIVGAGPAGLTCAGELAVRGYAVTIFEALHRPGGVLVYGIPEFRLPKKIVHQEIDQLRDLGVEIVTNYVVGLRGSVDDLFAKGYDAVFIGTGAGLPKFLNIPGENLCGVFSANEYLTRVNLMEAYRYPESKTPVIMGRQVAVLGAGNTAMDSARTAVRLGAERVSIVYRRTHEEVPARAEEVEHAKEEGVEFKFLRAPVEILDDGKGWVRAMRCQVMELGEPDDSGRRRPVAVKGQEETVECDVIVNAVGSGSNQLLFRTAKDIQLTKWGNIVADEATGRTSKSGVYAGGDIVTGAATVILAMGAGRGAAIAIDQQLRNGGAGVSPACGAGVSPALGGGATGN